MRIGGTRPAFHRCEVAVEFSATEVAMVTRFVRVIGSTLLALAWATVAKGQSTAGLELVPYAGYMMLGKHLEGPIGTSIGTAAAPVFGAQVGLGFSPAVSLVGNFAYGKSDLELGLPIVGGLKIGESEVMTYDAALQIKTTMQNGVSPFAQAGAGALSYKITGGPFELDATNFVWVAGAGIDADLGRSLGIRLMARDYIGKFDTQDATGFELNNDIKHNVTISAGIRLRM